MYHLAEGDGVEAWASGPEADAVEQVECRRAYNECVPELSRFFGIIIRMFAEAGSPHHGAHFHAY